MHSVKSVLVRVFHELVIGEWRRKVEGEKAEEEDEEEGKEEDEEREGGREGGRDGWSGVERSCWPPP